MATRREQREAYLHSLGLSKERCKECGEVITGSAQHKCAQLDILQNSNLDEDFLFS